MSVHIIFEAHSTTFDNEAHRASGWNDVALSPLGEQQSRALGERYKHHAPQAIFCSDLQRAVQTAKIAFPNDEVSIVEDDRLRECNYGTMTQSPSAQVDLEKPKRIHEPFPEGESYEQTTKRMAAFLEELKKKCNGMTVMIIGHRATQYALEHLINGHSLEEVIPASWKWQPGWKYEL